MFAHAAHTAYCVCWYLEDAESLDIVDELQFFVLRLIFTPKIKEDLLQFQNSLDNHALRSTQNRTSNHLWGLGQNHYTPSDDVTNVDDSYGVDFEAPVSLEDELAIDAIPTVEILTCDEKTLLLQSVNIMRKSTSFEVDNYIEVLEEANRIVSERR